MESKSQRKPYKPSNVIDTVVLHICLNKYINKHIYIYKQGMLKRRYNSETISCCNVL